MTREGTLLKHVYPLLHFRLGQVIHQERGGDLKSEPDSKVLLDQQPLESQGVNKQNVSYTYNGIPSSLEKEGDSDAHCRECG